MNEFHVKSQIVSELLFSLSGPEIFKVTVNLFLFGYEKYSTKHVLVVALYFILRERKW